MQRGSSKRNVINLYEVYEDNDFVHLVMDNCQGGALSEMFEEADNDHQSDGEPADSSKLEQCFSEAPSRPVLTSELEIKKIIRKILFSIKLLHDTGICHRDLKLDNVMFASRGKEAVFNADIRIVDFGLSASFNIEDQSLAKFSQIVGTPHYLAPEVLQGSYNEKCDIWAVGVMAYLLFSQGLFPFNGNNEVKLYKAITNKHIYLPPKPKTGGSSTTEFTGVFDWNTMMSEDAKHFVSCLLIKDLAKRPSAQQALNHKWLSIEYKS